MPHALQGGIIPAPVTPFAEDGSVDWDALERYLAQLVESGIPAIAMNMAAAEATALDQAEQLEVLRCAKRVAGTTLPVISGLIAPHTAGATAHAKRLVEAGADALVVFPPLPTFVSKPLPVAMVVDFHAAVAEAVDVPLIAFHTAVAGYPAGTISALAKIDALVAIKDAGFDFDQSWELLDEAADAGGKVAVLTGNDTFVLEALLMGCPGALIGLAGTFTAELVRMHALASTGRITEAYAVWNAIAPMARLCWSRPLRDYRARMKYLLMKQGVIPTDVTRAPQATISEADRRKADRLFERHHLGDRKYLPGG